MKRFAFLLACTFALGATAQNRMAINGQVFRFGLKGVYNSTWLFNNNISDRGDEVDNKAGFGTAFGLTTAYNFTDESGIVIDLLFTSHKAEFESGDGASTLTENMSYIDIPVLFRLGPPDGGGYVEVGPMISFLSGVEEDADNALLSYSGKDVSDDFSGTAFSAVLGFGYDFQVGQNFLITAGLRFAYGFSDATTEYTEPELDTEANSLMSLLTHYDAENNFNYSPTHRAFGGLNIGILYRP